MKYSERPLHILTRCILLTYIIQLAFRRKCYRLSRSMISRVSINYAFVCPKTTIQTKFAVLFYNHSQKHFSNRSFDGQTSTLYFCLTLYFQKVRTLYFCLTLYIQSQTKIQNQTKYRVGPKYRVRPLKIRFHSNQMTNLGANYPVTHQKRLFLPCSTLTLSHVYLVAHLDLG